MFSRRTVCAICTSNSGPGRVTGTAQIDLLKLKQAATGEAAGWLGTNLLSGERPVTVTARIESREGRARADVERVEISGVPIEGPALDFLIHAISEVKVDEWFRLTSRIGRIAVTPAGVSVIIRRARKNRRRKTTAGVPRLKR